jgi:hypothetical protein
VPAKQYPRQVEVETISEAEFSKLCEEVYRDRFEIYRFNPGAGKSEALLWMLLGCLISLLSVGEEELQSLDDSSSQEPYADAICQLLRGRAGPSFDPRPYLERFSKSVENR